MALMDAATLRSTVTNMFSGPGESFSKTSLAGVMGIITEYITTMSPERRTCRIATTANLDLTTTGLTAIDGVTPVAGDRVLVKDQTSAPTNGIYVASAAAWARAVDADTSDRVIPNMVVGVEEGTAGADTHWELTTNAPIVLGTSNLVFAKVSGPGTATQSVDGLMAATDKVILDGFKLPVRFATDKALAAYTRTANVITAGANGAIAANDGISSVLLAVGDRVLLKDGAAAADNGIYVITAIGAGGAPFVLTRAADYNTSAEVSRGGLVPVMEGTVNKGLWRMSQKDAITLNTTSLTFEKMGGSKGLIWRQTTSSDSTVPGNGADVTEANYGHEAITFPIGILAVARRTVRYRAILHVTGQNAADTQRPRVRLGGATGTLIFDMTTVQNAPANTQMFIEGWFQVKTVGASGKVAAMGRSYDTINSALRENGAYDGALDTTATAALVVTSVPSTNSASNITVLKHFEVEVYDA